MVATTINLDLLKKLTRLANHNPNEHEANSAARRVCQMLEGGGFSLGQTQPQPSAQPRPSSYRQPDWYEMVMEQIRKQEQREKAARAAADFKQQTESRPKPEEPKYKPHTAQEEFFKHGEPRRPNPRAAKDFWGQGHEYVIYDEMADPPQG